jgi:biofilm PGA synthesis lipoprotein PgaB
MPRPSKKQLATLMKQYDFVLFSIPPLKNNKRYLQRLIQQANTFPKGLLALMFELQIFNSTNSSINSTTPTSFSDTHLINGLQQLHQYGARNFGYFPDDALQDQPRLKILRPLMSLKTNSGRTP